MPVEQPVIEPLPSAPQPEPEVEPTNPQPELPDPKPGEGLPEPLLKIPAFQALMAGKPGALSVNLKLKTSAPEAKLVAKNKAGLMKAGIGFYRSLAGDLGVIFNQLYISGPEIQAADKAGQLLQIAPDFDSIGGKVARSGSANPTVDAQTPGGPVTPPVPMPPQMATGGGLPGAAQTKLSAARTKNILPGSPTSGPAPGAGTLVRSILKPTI